MDSITPSQNVVFGTLADIQRNSIYVTFNAPEVNEYHRSIFITHPSTRDGTLFHARWTAETGWFCERRDISNLSKARSLVLMYRLGSYDRLTNSKPGEQEWFTQIEEICKGVDLDPSRPREEGDDVLRRLGNPLLGGYSCLVWSVDVVRALEAGGLVDLKGKEAEGLLMEARLLAGPEDGTSTVGKEHGAVRVVN